MKAQTFLDSFAVIAEAPSGIQRLKGLILGLAVKGRLVAQVPDDEPASRLLERSRAELSLRDLSIGQTAVFQDAPPPGWAWATVGEIAHHQIGKMLNRSRMAGQPVRYLRSVNVRDGFLDMSDINEMLMEERDLQRYDLRDGDVLVIEGGDVGRSAVWRGPNPDGLVYQNQLHRLRPATGILSVYLLLVLRQYRWSGTLAARSTGVTIKHLSATALRSLPMLVPPTGEQERIVAKVEELMALCDSLEKCQQRRRRTTSSFRLSALQSLTAAKTPDDLRVAWDRIGSNLPAITSDSKGVESFKEVVLQLAFEGRLTSPEGGDGSGAQTLAALWAERARLADEGAIAKPKASAEVAKDRLPFELPTHWVWVHVEDVVTHIVDCLHRTPPYSEQGIPAIRTSDVEPGRLLLDQARLVDETTYREQTRRLVPQGGDVFYSREGGRFGIAAVVPEGVRVCLSQRMMHFRCGRGMSPDYFSWFLNSPLGFGQARADVGGSASPHVNIKSIRRFVMPLPPHTEQLRVVGVINRFFDAIEHLAGAVERRSGVAELYASAAESSLAG